MTKKKIAKEPDLVEQVRAALNKCKGDFPKIASLTNRELTYKWLTMFASGEIKDPSARRLILLGRYIGIKIISTPGRHFLEFTPE